MKKKSKTEKFSKYLLLYGSHETKTQNFNKFLAKKKMRKKYKNRKNQQKNRKI